MAAANKPAERHGFTRSESTQALAGAVDGNLGSGAATSGELPRFYSNAAPAKKKASGGCYKLLMVLAALLVVAGITVGVLTATKVIDWNKITGNSAGGSGSGSSSSSPSTDRSGGTSGSSSSPTSGSTVAGDVPVSRPVIQIEGNRIVPIKDATLFGIHIWGDHIDWAPASPTEFNKQSGINAAIFGGFVFVDPTDGVREPEKVLGWADQVKAAHAAMLLSVEPAQAAGLDMMTDAVIAKVADVAKKINDKGVPLLLRFAHEMNGGWNPWSQKPAKYKATWQRLARVVRQRAPLTSLVWAPNGPIGYPWPHETYAAKSGSQDYKDMDTNGDGTVDAKDDPFTPFFPGKEWVDWVGGSIFHFDSWPFGKNEMPVPGAANTMVMGSATQPWSLAKFAKAQGLPFGAFESSITYYPNATSGPVSPQLNLDMKKEWVSQILSKELRAQSDLALVVWFEIAKFEAGGLYRDFTMFKDPVVAAGMKQELKKYSIAQAKA